MQLNFHYSPEEEAVRIEDTLHKYAWFKGNGYRINLPSSLREKIENGEKVEAAEILDTVKSEYNVTEYDAAKELLSTEFEKVKEKFSRDLKSLGGPVYDSYDVRITKYGVGGSYGYPNKIQVNIDYGKHLSWMTLPHEMVHLSIEQWIQDYKVDHWTKERLVDLIMSRFFQGEIKLQKATEERVDMLEVFSTHFPDMKKIVEMVSKLS